MKERPVLKPVIPLYIHYCSFSHIMPKKETPYGKILIMKARVVCREELHKILHIYIVLCTQRKCVQTC